MNKQETINKAVTALEKNLDILTEHKNPIESDLAIRSIPAILKAVQFLTKKEGETPPEALGSIWEPNGRTTLEVYAGIIKRAAELGGDAEGSETPPR